MPRNRRSIRLKGYDYSQFGYYFVTICAQDRELIFENKNIVELINNYWCELKNKFKNIDLDEYVIMPNHIHGIIVINNPVGADLCVRPTNTNKTNIHPISNKGAQAGAPLQKHKLGTIIQWFKTMTTNYYIQGIKTNNWPWFAGKLWQRNYYERIIRNNQELNRIRNYIINNPKKWDLDRNNPKNF